MYFDEALESKALRNTKAKIAFLMGAYCKSLMRKQAERLSGNKPFFKRFKDLKMTYEYMSKELYTEAFGKFRQYGDEHRTLEALINKYMLEDDDSFLLSDKEANYYFVLGASYNKKKEHNNDNEEAKAGE